MCEKAEKSIGLHSEIILIIIFNSSAECLNAQDMVSNMVFSFF